MSTWQVWGTNRLTKAYESVRVDADSPSGAAEAANNATSGLLVIEGWRELDSEEHSVRI